MSNFGFTQMRLVNPYDVAFKEARSAVHSHYILENAQVFPTLAEAIADCELVAGTTSVGHRELHLPLYRLEPAAEIIREHLTAEKPVALLFGSEKFGLSNEDMSHCHWLMRIHTVDVDRSMNLGQAVAVCLYELARDSRAVEAPPEKLKVAGAGDNEQITAMLVEALERSGYIKALTAESAKAKVRRLVRRLNLSARDAPVVLGMLRQILWKLGD